jgi:HTH-type transcriptional regulator / antitoxin HigA
MGTNMVHSDLAIPPGEFLEEVIAALGISRDDLANRMRCRASQLGHLLRGDMTIDADMARELEAATRVAAHIWNGLESEYRRTLSMHGGCTTVA